MTLREFEEVLDAAEAATRAEMAKPPGLDGHVALPVLRMLLAGVRAVQQRRFPGNPNELHSYVSVGQGSCGVCGRDRAEHQNFEVSFTFPIAGRYQPLCADCGHPQNNHPFRHPFKTWVVGSKEPKWVGAKSLPEDRQKENDRLAAQADERRNVW